MPFELRVALRYLTARRKQAFISVISGISILGVTVGVMAVLIALGLMTGLQTEVRSRILGATAHLSLFKGRSDAIEDYRAVVEEVRKVPRVLGAAPVVYGKGLLSSPGGSAVAIEHFERGLTSPKLVTAGRWRRALEKAGVIFIDEDDEAGPGVRLKAKRKE